MISKEKLHTDTDIEKTFESTLDGLSLDALIDKKKDLEKFLSKIETQIANGVEKFRTVEALNKCMQIINYKLTIIKERIEAL